MRKDPKDTMSNCQTSWKKQKTKDLLQFGSFVSYNYNILQYIYTVNVLTFMRDWLAKHEATRCVLRDILCVHPSVYWEDCGPQPGTKAKHLLQTSRVEQKWTCDAFKLHTVIPCFTENAATTSGVFVSTWTRKVCHVSSGFNGKCLRVLATYAHDFLQEFSFRLAAWQGAATWLTNCDANKMWQNKE